MPIRRPRCTPDTVARGLLLAALLCMGGLACSTGPGPAVQPAPHGEPPVEPGTGALDIVEPVPPEVAPPGPLRGAARLIEYAPVSLAEREGHVVELVEDLVIEERPDDRRYNFHDAVELVVDEQDRIYVHDSERYRIVVYRPDGGFERAYGGAGEMAPFHLGWIALVGGKLAISTGDKIAVWSLDGRHLYDRSLLRLAFSRDLQGTTDGHLVGSFRVLDRDEVPWFSVEKIALDEDRSVTYGAVSPRHAVATTPRARAGFAATRTGETYLTRGDEYVVQGFSADGAALWVLRVDAARGEAAGDAAPPPALSVPQAGLGRGNPLRVDGRGNLYVFPHIGEAWDRDVVPVDVYSPTGRRLFAGFISDRSWLRAKDDAVYGIEFDEESGRQRIVRYRLRAPFLRGEG